MTIEEIMKKINEAHENGFSHFAIRGDDIDVTVGQLLDCSHDWDMENDIPSKDYLNGTCGISCGYLWYDGEAEDKENIEKAINIQKKYYRYNHICVIAGDSAEFGDDKNEVIISNARVIAVIE